MAEKFVFTIAAGVLGELGSFLRDEIGLFRGAKKDLHKLQSTMSAIKAVLLDAEEKQTHSDQVRDWLLKLEGVVYDADDLVDDFHTEALRRRVIPGNKLTKRVCIFFSSSNQLAFRLKMGHKIKEIREALDGIRGERDFRLEERVEETRSVSTKARETHSFVRKEEVFGRDDDKMKILKLLFDDDDETEENVSTITIVGIGGLGKTTLSQLVFNDATVQKHFEPRLWVCVSQVFDLRLIVGNIIKSATNTSPDQNLAMDQLQNLLRREIDGKRYLLVLDDVWNEDRTKWLELKSFLMGGARGSRVLLTTRSGKVAKVTCPFLTYHLEGLDQDKSWSLFEKQAFGQIQDFEKSDFVALGKEIVEKCKGVPLAIKSIGSILYFKNSKAEWLFFKGNELAKAIQQEDNNIIPTLKLSYNHLPSSLKHCFAYCCLFPKDHVFDVQMLINLWMAQGFIKADQNKRLEDVGYEYFKDLLWRSFFQEAEKDEWGNIRSCKMHDLMHDLATSVAGTGSVLIDKDSMNIGENLIHVSFDSSLEDIIYLKGLSSLLDRHYKLRTFISFSALNGKHELALKECMKICSEFKLLRALDLSRFSCIKKLPNSLGELKHLRYLNIYNLKEIQVLPDSITKLQNLQTLNLSGCEKLSSLPRDMHKMVSLRYLEISSCGNLKSLPEAMSNLSSLHSLKIYKCWNLKSLPEAMGNLSSLHSLKIHSCPGLKSLPEAMGNLSSLHSLEIRSCPHLKSLPEAMGNLSSLHYLEILGLYNLKSLPEAMGNLSSLHSLEILGLYNLESLPEAMGNLSSLHSLEIHYCYNLKSLPEAMGNLSSLHSLEIRALFNLKSFPEVMGNLSSLQYLNIRDCPNLTSLPERQMLSALRSLRIVDCPILKQRYNKTSGEDWPKIAHIPDVDVY